MAEIRKFLNRGQLTLEDKVDGLENKVKAQTGRIRAMGDEIDKLNR
jgi:hypothetical protein